MKRVPIRHVSERQAARKRELGVPKFGTRCGWCLKALATEYDHLVLRSLLPGENRDHEDNRMPSCRTCNRKRAEGKRPPWAHLSSHQQRFVLQQKGTSYAGRYFTGAPE